MVQMQKPGLQANQRMSCPYLADRLSAPDAHGRELSPQRCKSLDWQVRVEGADVLGLPLSTRYGGILPRHNGLPQHQSEQAQHWYGDYNLNVRMHGPLHLLWREIFSEPNGQGKWPM
jgi:hypothetical protein